MPSWISKGGKWYPREEYAVDPKKPKGQEVYEGPDREATKILKESGVEHLGQDYHMNPDLIRQARELGYKDVDTYLKEMFGYEPEKAAKKAAKAQKDVVDHKPKAPKKAKRFASGGDSWANPKEGIKGDFGLPKNVNEGQLAQRA